MPTKELKIPKCDHPPKELVFQPKSSDKYVQIYYCKNCKQLVHKPLRSIAGEGSWELQGV